MRRARGFTLLETIIALAILAVALVAIMGINTGAIDNHLYAKQLTIATMLARGKMSDIETKLQSEGFTTDDEAEDGTFEDQGHPEVLWHADIIRPKTENVDAATLLQHLTSGIDALLPPGTASNTSASPSNPTAAGGLTGLLGPAAGMLQGQLQSMITDLGKTIREVRLTVKWSQGTQTEQFQVVTHILSLGKGTDQAISTPTTQLPQNPAGIQTGTPLTPGGTFR